MKARKLCWLLAAFISQPALAGEELALEAKQVQALGIVTAALPAQQHGELAGLPAQVVVPGDQLFIVSTQLPAMVEQTLAGVGDSVKKGQVLVRLQSPALADAQRTFLQASTQEQLARDNLARDEALWKEGIIAESRYRTAKSQHVEASAALAERKQALRLAGMADKAIAQLQSGGELSSGLAIASPITGVVLEKNISAGQSVDAAVPLFKVARLEPLGLEIQAPAGNTASLKTGAAVTVPAAGAQGKLVAIGRSLSGGNQTILLRALMQKGAQNLHPGQFVEASIATATGGGAQWSVPNSALVRISGNATVFIETAKGFRPETVTVLHEGAQSSLVTGKFKGGEKIAVRGLSSLKARMVGTGGED